ncbi:hypothetical protein Goshw_018408 [Gossypium schwendimanii]|uniref:DUF4283 domain-containing protein n=1 Tax=Gossypium schwendimanii TaxID=34291 RepID=A0A7J9KM16_GOSSC|nr:hypothetical protein [Gossypium schwendimanii]
MSDRVLVSGGSLGRAAKKTRMRLNKPPDPNDPIVDEHRRTVIVKLFGRKISYHAMSNKLQVIWKTKQSLHVLDLENDYFFVRFQNENEYLAAILEGLWTIFAHYLIVRPWTRSFSIDQAQPNNLLVWVRLPDLPEGMYTIGLLTFIGWVIGPVTKIDQNTDTRARGQFARLTVFVDFSQPLVSKIMIDGRIQWVEYQSLPLVCFNCGWIQWVEYQSLPLVCFDCGWYGHNREICPYIFDQEMTSKMVGNHLPREMPEILKCVEEERYDPWMLVKRKQKRGTRLVLAKSVKATTASESNIFRFEFLSENLGDDSGDFAQEVNVDDADQTFKTQIEEDMREKNNKMAN